MDILKVEEDWGKVILPHLLFVLVMENLSRTLKTLSYLPDFKFHSMYKSLELTHLAFADDLMVFCNGIVTSVNRVIKVLTYFNVVTGLKANMSKSSFFLAGVTDGARTNCLLEQVLH